MFAQTSVDNCKLGDWSGKGQTSQTTATNTFCNQAEAEQVKRTSIKHCHCLPFQGTVWPKISSFPWVHCVHCVKWQMPSAVTTSVQQTLKHTYYMFAHEMTGRKMKLRIVAELCLCVCLKPCTKEILLETVSSVTGPDYLKKTNRRVGYLAICRNKTIWLWFRSTDTSVSVCGLCCICSSEQ